MRGSGGLRAGALSSTPSPLVPLLDAGAVGVGYLARDAADAVRAAVQLLVEVGAVGPEYADAAVAREATYPTGLLTEPVGTALPHADGGVVHASIAVLTLARPVVFGEMGTGNPRVPVQVVVVLAIPAGDAHVAAIGALAGLIQQPGFLADLMAASTAAALDQTVRDWLSRLDRKD